MAITTEQRREMMARANAIRAKRPKRPKPRPGTNQMTGRRIRVSVRKVGTSLYTPFQLMEALLRANKVLRRLRANAIFRADAKNYLAISRAMLAVMAAKEEFVRISRQPRYPVDTDEMPGLPVPLRNKSSQPEKLKPVR